MTESALTTALCEVVEALEGVAPVAVIGGIAVSSRTEPRVARVGHLIALKILARDDRERPQDLLDLHALSKVADRTEWARAAKAVAMIEKRGFARSKDLRGELGRWRRRNPTPARMKTGRTRKQ